LYFNLKNRVKFQACAERCEVFAERGVVSGTKEKSAVWDLHPAVTHVEFMGGVRLIVHRLFVCFGFYADNPYSMV